MKNIVLLCAQGMSTGMLMNKMCSAAKASNYECTISATSVSQAKSAAETAAKSAVEAAATDTTAQ